MEKKQIITAGNVTAELEPSESCHNIIITIIRDGKRLFDTCIAFGGTSRDLTAPEAAKTKAAGFDPAGRRMLPSRPPATLSTELALAIDQISLQCKAATDARSAARKAAIDGIDGLSELRAALADHTRYHRQFEAMMEDEQNDGARPPRAAKGNIDELCARFQRAAAYLEAESWNQASNYAKSAAGSKAMEQIEAGQDYEQAIRDMKAKWSAHCEEHVWD